VGLDVDGAGNVLATIVASADRLTESAVPLADSGIDARVVARYPLFEGDPAPNQAHFRVP
jgi:hypothetical protein